jgi:hypothetical protein
MSTIVNILIGNATELMAFVADLIVIETVVNRLQSLF